MGDRNRRRLAGVLATAIALLMLSPQLGAVAGLPDELVMGPGTVAILPASSALKAEATGGDGVIANIEERLDASSGALALTAGEAGEGEVTFKLLGVVPLRTVKLTVQPDRVLIPGGQSVGVAIRTGGVVVVGNSDLGKTASPARRAGLKSGDVIQSVNGTRIMGAKALSECLSEGQTAHLQVLRGEEVMECDVTPERDERDGEYRLGAWVRDSTAGVGTLTFYDPQSGGFGALGHAITDIDTGVMMPVGEGALYRDRVVDVTPSRAGAPGELTGDFLGETQPIGSVTQNSEYGIFGTAAQAVEGALYPQGLSVAGRGQIHTGEASLLTTVEGDRVCEYACEVVRINANSAPAARALVIRVTDPELLAATGGIVQGMSGSPLIQDGRIIGAVTHVMVNDPTMGYGICIGTMLDAAA